MFKEFQSIVHSSTEQHPNFQLNSSSQKDMVQRVTSRTAIDAGYMPAAVNALKC